MRRGKEGRRPILLIFYRISERIIGRKLGHGEFGCLEKACGAVQLVLVPQEALPSPLGAAPRPPRGSPTPNYRLGYVLHRGPRFLHLRCPGHVARLEGMSIVLRQ